MNIADAPVHAATFERLTAIDAVIDRMVQAAQTAKAARREVATLRRMRNLALFVLRERRGWSKVSCYSLVGLNRRTFDDALDRLAEEMPFLTEDPEQVEPSKIADRYLDAAKLYFHLLDLTAKEAADIAKAKGGRLDEQQSVWRTAATIRNEAARELMRGVHGKPWKNARIARATGLSTPSVHLVRQGKETSA